MPLEGLSNSKEWHNKYTQDGLIGKNPVFRKALEKIAVLAIAEAPVLICGETGTGKELFARAIHYHGSRKGGPFIPVNCGALPDHIFENELFGHTKGAFTDASFEQKGLIGEAEGGTLFLDEIDALSFAAQIKLLRFLQDAEFRPLGSSKSFKANVRVLTATNKDIQQIVIDKEFRADLFYRISFFSLVIPPLRERLDDIPALTDYFIAKTMAPNPKKTSSLSSDCLSKLMGYTWPGNIRELQGVLQRSLAFSTSDQIGAYDIDLPFTCHTNDGTDDTFRIAKSKVVKQFERSYLLNLLATYRGNVSKASKAAGKERRSFQRLLRKYGLQRNVFLRTHSPSHEYNNASGLQRDS
ncbi:MAG: hypothetical protein NPIRA02_09810 [Nitrospirales bacterium]|nr:MAG: hypothetical protein NPIRA02_09810 [Nitrospirales bacterium]